jgi:plastocyanin
MTTTRRRAGPGRAVLGGVLLLVLASCGGPGPQTPGATSPAPATAGARSTAPSGTPPPTSVSGAATSPTASGKPAVVRIRSYAYLPAAPVVIVGQPIEIINSDSVAHTWSAAPGAGWTYTSGNLDPGQRTTFPGFTKAGRYRFLCYYHAEMPSMTGTVTVKAAP